MKCNQHVDDPCTCQSPSTSSSIPIPGADTDSYRQRPPVGLPPLMFSSVRQMCTSHERTSHVRIPHVVVMVGLPARGKTYMAKKLTRYLNWMGINTRVFNLGEYRRKATQQYKNHNFFRTDNSEAMQVRQQCAIDALKDVQNWLTNEKGEVAVFDATNTTRDRREFLHRSVVVDFKFKLFYIESICDDLDLIKNNIRQVKLNGPDYKDMSEEDAMRDFMQRIHHYEKQYHPLDESLEKHLSFMKIYNTGEKVVVHKLDGVVQARIVYYFMNVHVTPRSIYLCRHGESEFNVSGRIGGDADLSNRGETYAKELATFINGQNIPNLRVWTSLLKRTIATAKGIEAPQERWKQLNEIDAGVCEGLTYQEIQDKYPTDFEARDKDKLRYRYPRGESYEDLIVRLEPIIMELERLTDILVIGHQAVLRCLLAYFLDLPLEQLPYINVPLHTVIKLTPVAYGCERQDIPLGVPSVDTYRRQPSIAGTMEDEEVATKPNFSSHSARGTIDDESPENPSR